MFQVVDDHDADSLWQNLAKLFLPDGPAIEQSGRGGQATEVLHAAFSIRDPRQRWIGSRSPALNPAFAIAEVLWIVTGRNDSAFLNYFNPAYPTFAGKGPTYHGAYGFRLRKHFGFDQLERAYLALSANETSRQVVLQIWDSRVDLPNDDGSPSSTDIPCNLIAILKVRDRRLEWTQVMRSNDVFRGLPHNIVQFTSLQEILAGWLGVALGAYNHISNSLHFYKADGLMSQRLRPTVVPINSDDLALPRCESERAFSQLSQFGDLARGNSNGPEDIIKALDKLEVPAAYFNLAAILAAEALRRRGRVDLARKTGSRCSNACLTFLFDRWLERKANEVREGKIKAQ
jgi:thymidylate synthase